MFTHNTHFMSFKVNLMLTEIQIHLKDTQRREEKQRPEKNNQKIHCSGVGSRALLYSVKLRGAL